MADHCTILYTFVHIKIGVVSICHELKSKGYGTIMHYQWQQTAQDGEHSEAKYDRGCLPHRGPQLEGQCAVPNSDCGGNQALQDTATAFYQWVEATVYADPSVW